MQSCYERSHDKNILEMPFSEFSYLQTFNSLLTPKNIERVFKISGSWINVQVMRLQGETTNIYMATNVYHRLYKVIETSDRLNFGELLLISSRNIAEKTVLRNEEDKIVYNVLRNRLFEAKEANNLESIIGYNKDCFTDEYLENLHPDSPQKSANTNGLCASTSLYLIGKILTLPEFSESALIELIRELQKGVPAEIAAKQELYQEFHFDIVGPKEFELSCIHTKSHLISSTIDTLCLRAERLGIKKELQEAILSILDGQVKFTQRKLLSELKYDPRFHQLLQDFEVNEVLKAEKYRNNALAHLYGFKQDLEGTYQATKLLGKAASFSSSKEHLKDYEKLENGVYQLSFRTLNDSHSIVYIKQKDGNGYFFDPNKGIIKCGDYTHASILLKLFSTYPPPSNRLPSENNERNYQLNLTKYR